MKTQLKTKLDSLSPKAKEWLRSATHGAADINEIPYMDKDALKECEAAGLTERRSSRSKYWTFPGDVMDAVYSNDYFNPAPTQP